MAQVFKVWVCSPCFKAALPSTDWADNVRRLLCTLPDGFFWYLDRAGFSAVAKKLQRLKVTSYNLNLEERPPTTATEALAREAVTWDRPRESILPSAGAEYSRSYSIRFVDAPPPSDTAVSE